MKMANIQKGQKKKRGPNNKCQFATLTNKYLFFVPRVQDGVTLNIDFVDPLLKSVVIPGDFLNKTYVGRCSYDYKAGCSNPGGMIADFNVWDRALTEKEMHDWTTCRWVNP